MVTLNLKSTALGVSNETESRILRVDRLGRRRFRSLPSVSGLSFFHPSDVIKANRVGQKAFCSHRIFEAKTSVRRSSSQHAAHNLALRYLC
ncbi:uncharacterized protein FOMMEDRAFT_133833 [Fomitiporia mediterranea MF3/22]|uniref:uncharacterized protein n=1 Tax=Fomitiporia mediterranea (strain MF3/22) TaxID=694068 RepID=UPI00044080B6|nr:uncharacterized protein FOMMEDRAFT_133833 [Fomitiporia mediterranea MF3/22]EJD04624.1 hypothetical protein FOMMEDRAFT_133833 [Fomitiporia mediterranea MF3/22]